MPTSTATVALVDIIANNFGKKTITDPIVAAKLVEALATLSLTQDDLALILEQAKHDLKRDEGLLSRRATAK